LAIHVRRVPFGRHLPHLVGDRLASRLVHARPGAGSHPVVDEPGAGRAQISGAHRRDGVVADGGDLQSGRMLRVLGGQQREQHRLEQDERLDPARIGQRRPQGHGAAVRVADQMEPRARGLEHWLEQRHLVGEPQRPLTRPRRAPTRAVQIVRKRPARRSINGRHWADELALA
jgi:hypothetical protein